MTYHQRTWDLFGMVPRQSPVAHTMLDKLEGECGVAFPAAVREWYATVCADDLFWLHQGDPEYMPNSPLDGPYILHEQQMGGHTMSAYVILSSPLWAGNLSWAVMLDPAQADPPVYVSKSTKRREWYPAGVRFSDMLYAALWDIHTETALYEHSGRIEAAPALLLPTLTACYERLPTTVTQQTITHRFQGQGVRVIVLYFPVQGTTSVLLYADTLDPIRRARRVLAPIEDIRWNRVPGLEL